ncbi:MAG: hypothetical protein M4D80_22735 [Myxococcota bacterium]|nr:hypothetical protein [Myxococcota bacterium]
MVAIDDDAKWELIEGDRFCLVLDRSAVSGHEEALAKRLSSLALEAPVYLLVYNADVDRVDAYIAGQQAGVIGASAYAVASAVGCALEDGRYGDVDLTPRVAPKAAPGDRMIYGRTLAQWHHDITYEEGWEYITDAIEDAVPALELLEDAAPDARVIAYKLVSALGYHNLLPHAERAIAALTAFADTGPGLLAANAREDADELTVRHDKQLVAKEIPWLSNQYAEIAVAELLRLLADPRVSVRRAVYAWLAGCSLRGEDRVAIAAFLVNVDEPDRVAQDYASYALGNLR